MCGPRKGEIWLDNSFNEKMKADDMITLGVAYDAILPDKVIAPDSPEMSAGDIVFNWRKVQSDFYLPPKRVIAVCSSEQMYLTLREQGATSLAVSYWTRDTIRVTENGMWMSDCHFLGLLNPEELITFRPKTCDTSMPIKLAMKGWDLNEWKRRGYPHIHTKDLGKWGGDYFNAQLDEPTLLLAKENIRRLREVIR